MTHVKYNAEIMEKWVQHLAPWDQVPILAKTQFFTRRIKKLTNFRTICCPVWVVIDTQKCSQVANHPIAFGILGKTI